jgi:DNA repair protein RecN (Recombination protein N)
MLMELRIENFAIIQNLNLRFESGLTTFTGETGAGKSILLDGITCLVGGKSDVTMIRSDAERANLEAVFSIPETNKPAINEILEREELMDDPSLITLSREIRREGRSVARVNGRSVSQNILKELGAFLIDIHGQSEHLSLLNIHQHLGLLDRFADIGEPLSAYRLNYHQQKKIQKELNELHQAEKDAARMTDLLNYQIQEIDTAHIQPGEEADLRQELSRLANAEKLSSLAKNALNLLDEGGPDSQSITELLGEVTQSMIALANVDQSLRDLSEQTSSISVLSGDISRELQTYLDNIEFNPKRLDQVEERLSLINNLKRKYGENEEAILDFAQKARLQMEKITHAEERILALETKEKELKEKLAGQARILSESRKQASQNLGQLVESELNDLHMSGARFAVDIQCKPDEQGLSFGDDQTVKYDENGIDQVEFLIAPNPGEGLKPLVKIASGGETSRLMLALKNVLARADTIPTLIFDEIDQGIGGRVGAVVGEKLWNLGRQHQVFCVTHLPQLAAYGNQHYRVYKEMSEGRTLTHVVNLEDSARVSELANMFGGESQTNRIAAQETLQTANERKAIISL